MAVHPVTLKAVGKHVVAVPRNLRHVKIGDTIRFRPSVKSYEIKVKFKGRWPFKEARRVVTDETPLTFQREGEFEFFCALRPMGQSYPNPETAYRVHPRKGRWIIYPGDSGGHGSVDPPGGHK